MRPSDSAQIRLTFEVETDAPQEKLDPLLKLTERYCVVYPDHQIRPAGRGGAEAGIVREIL